MSTKFLEWWIVNGRLWQLLKFSDRARLQMVLWVKTGEVYEIDDAELEGVGSSLLADLGT